MNTTLTDQITQQLTTQLGRVPTANEIIAGQNDALLMTKVQQHLNIGLNSLTIDTTGDIQNAIDDLSADGGGTLYLTAGTFTMTSDITIPSSIRIQGVGSDGTIIDFSSGAHGIKMIGTLGNEVVSPFLGGLTLQNSTTDLVRADYVINLGCNDLTCRNGLTGMNLSNIETANLDNSLVDACGTGVIATDSEFFTMLSMNVTGSTSGGGFALENVFNSTTIASSVDDCIGGGFIFDNCGDFGFEDFSVTNITGIGCEFVGASTNSIGILDGFIDGCSSHGVYIHDTSSKMQFAGANTFSNNGGYGISIAAGSSAILITGNYFDNNTSGAVNDAGTATLIRSNIGVADN